MSTLSQKVKHELRELIPVTLYFFVTFQLLALTDELVLKQYGIRVSVFVAAMIGALIAAKVIVITDHLALLNRFPNKPPVYKIVWKTLVYFAAWLLVRYSEHFIHFWRATGNPAEANSRIFTEIVWPHFWAVQLWMFILLLVFCTARELVRALGRERITALFFHAPASIQTEQHRS
jgi:hypothetical protein